MLTFFQLYKMIKLSNSLICLEIQLRFFANTKIDFFLFSSVMFPNREYMVTNLTLILHT